MFKVRNQFAEWKLSRRHSQMITSCMYYKYGNHNVDEIIRSDE